MKAATFMMILALVVSLASCTRAPRLTTSDPSRLEIRDEYLAKHPDGRYNKEIRNGGVKKGMSVIEVLASWGLPNMRRAQTDTQTEFWTYYIRDVHSNQLMSYQLTFENRVLKRWVHATDVAEDTRDPKERYGGTSDASAGDTPSSSSSGTDSKP